LYQNINRKEVNYCFATLFATLFCYKDLNYYPDYSTRRLYFGEVETPYICYAIYYFVHYNTAEVRKYIQHYLRKKQTWYIKKKNIKQRKKTWYIKQRNNYRSKKGQNNKVRPHAEKYFIHLVNQNQILIVITLLRLIRHQTRFLLLSINTLESVIIIQIWFWLAIFRKNSLRVKLYNKVLIK